MEGTVREIVEIMGRILKENPQLGKIRADALGMYLKGQDLEDWQALMRAMEENYIEGGLPQEEEP